MSAYSVCVEIINVSCTRSMAGHFVKELCWEFGTHIIFFMVLLWDLEGVTMLCHGKDKGMLQNSYISEVLNNEGDAWRTMQ